MAVSQQLCWKRVGHVEIQNAAGKMVKFYGLDFRFSVKSTGDIYNEFSVGVLGLTSNTINELTVWSPIAALRNPRKIAVYAGYDKEGESLVADGYIWYAAPTNPPEMWMNFECRKYLVAESEVKEGVSLNDVTRKEAFERIASICGMRLDYRASDADKKCSITIKAGMKKAGIAREAARIFGDTVYENCGMLIVADKNGEKRSPKNAKPISRDSGLLSMGNVDLAGARITTRLRSDIALLEWINLKSILMPSASGNYYVISKEIKGHLRGDEWQTEFRCLREVKK